MRRSITVLIIEDNPLDAAVVEQTLKRSGRVSFGIDIATNLADGLQRLAEKRHDALLLDLGLPDSNGLDALARLTAVSSETAVVVLTGFDDEPTALAALQQGAQDYLAKENLDAETLTRVLLYAVERLRLRRALERANDVLEQRVSERTAQLEEFATGIAHELTQPLQAIIGFSSAACSVADASETDEDLKELIHDIAAQAGHAGALIARFRQLIRHRDVPTEIVSINTMVENACQLSERLFKEQGIDVALNLSPDRLTIRADKTAIHQVILNLLQNALQALGSAETKSIAIRTFLSDTQMCVFEVADSGPGVDANLRTSLFDAFSTTREDGLGLGLAICKTIVERHGGSIEYDEAASGGAVFRVAIPRAGEIIAVGQTGMPVSSEPESK